MSTGAHLVDDTRRAYRRLPRTLGQQSAEPPRPGDLLVLAATAGQGVEWAILARDPARPGRLLAVPADSQPLVGSADVAIPASAPEGPLVLRCRFGGWFRVELFDQAAHTGTLIPEDLSRALVKWSAVQQSTIVGSILEQEVDDDLEYQDWVCEALEPARRALAARSPASERREVDLSPLTLTDANELGDPLDIASDPRPYGRFRSRLIALAASLSLALGVGLFWLQHQNERLDRRLVAALRQAVVINPLATFLEPPHQSRRGEVKELRLSAEVSHLLLFIPLKAPSPGRRYEAELIEEPTGRRLWASSELREDHGELVLGLPAILLPSGESTLRFFILEDGGRELLTEYALRIVED